MGAGNGIPQVARFGRNGKITQQCAIKKSVKRREPINIEQEKA